MNLADIGKTKLAVYFDEQTDRSRFIGLQKTKKATALAVLAPKCFIMNR